MGDWHFPLSRGALALAIVLAAAACDQRQVQQNVRSLTDVTGTLVGGQAGRTITQVGRKAEPLIVNSVMTMLTQNERNALANTERRTLDAPLPPGGQRTADWVSPDSPNRTGTVKVSEVPGTPRCRKVARLILVDGAEFQDEGVKCRNADGQWANA